MPKRPGRYVLSIRATDNSGLTRDPAAAVVWVNAEPGPVMRVRGNTRETPDGMPLGTAATGTDFGEVTEMESMDHAFAIENTGTQPLELAGAPRVEGDREFSLVAAPDLRVAPGARTSFSVRFAPIAVGPRAARVVIPRPAGGAPFTFALCGTGKISSAMLINCGGPASGPFAADVGFYAGHGWDNWSVPGASIDPSGVTNPPPKNVYQTERVGDCVYTIAHLEPGRTYRVRLHFLECSKNIGRPNEFCAPGKRKFHVQINGRQVLTHYDIFADVGADKAVAKEFEAVTDKRGAIAIDFINTDSGVAKINAIEVKAAK